MLQMLNAVLTAQGLHVAAALGIADQLADGARGVDDLANATGIARRDGALQLDDIGLVRVLRLVPSPIEKAHQPLHS